MDPEAQQPKTEAVLTRKPIYGIISAVAVPVAWLAAFVLVEIFRSGGCATPLILLFLASVAVGVIIAFVTAPIAIFRRGESKTSKVLGVFGVVAALSTLFGVLLLRIWR